MSWRVGSEPLDVYDGDRPVCQCHNAEDATRIVQAMNNSAYSANAVAVVVELRARIAMLEKWLAGTWVAEQ